jgi:hypothetical protein
MIFLWIECIYFLIEKYCIILTKENVFGVKLIVN